MLILTPRELAGLMDTARADLELIDVRNEDEYEEVHIPGVKLIPLPFLPDRIGEIDRMKKIIFICRSGGRSGKACESAEEIGIKGYNLLGGMNDFTKEYPQRVIEKNLKK